MTIDARATAEAMTAAVAPLLESTWRTDTAGFVPFTVEARTIGWIRSGIVTRLREFSRTFTVDARGVALHEALQTQAERSAAMAEVIRALADSGVVTGWRDELYGVPGDDGDLSRPLFTIERAAARVFGVTTHAVHVNGIAATPGGPAVWIARRSATKSIDPGMLDNMIGGGLAHGLSIRQTLVKEAWEEAGLLPADVAAATPGRRIRIRREVPEGLQSEIIFAHDVVLPRDIAPRNQDGEVSEFQLLPVADVIALLGAGNVMTPDASLVTLDWLDRSGVVPLPPMAQARAIFEAAT